MTRAPQTYRRLPGRSRSRFGLFTSERQTLWEGADHVLATRSLAYVETAKRFYFGDIQALVICRTRTGAVMNWVLGALAAVLALSVMGPAMAAGAWVLLFGIIPLFFAAWLVVNALLGPTCTCRLHTAVQVEDLTALRRLRTARRFAGIVKPLIEAAQGELTPVELDAGDENPVAVEASSYARAAVAPPIREEAELRHDSGNIHAAAFGVLFVDAFTNLQYDLRSTLGILVGVAVIVLAILALIRQRQSDLPAGMRNLTWALLGYLAVSFVFSMNYQVIYAMINPTAFNGLYMTSTVWMQGTVFDVFCAVSAVVEAVIAVLGIMSWRRFRAESAAAQQALFAEAEAAQSGVSPRQDAAVSPDPPVNPERADDA